MMKINNLNRWKNYDIKITFKENNENDIQMLIFLNEKLAYKTKRNSFIQKKYIVGKIEFNKFIPKYITKETTRLSWDNKREKKRFIEFCKKFKYSTCVKLQEETMMALNKVM